MQRRIIALELHEISVFLCENKRDSIVFCTDSTWCQGLVCFGSWFCFSFLFFNTFNQLTAAMAEFKSSRLPTRERRVKSAKARLTPPHPPAPEVENIVMNEKLAKMSLERVKSAKAIKNKHTSSGGVFAAGKPIGAGKGRFTTMYSQDFDGTYAPPPEIRPTSPTRRNNPHPSKVNNDCVRGFAKVGGAE